MGHRHHHGRSHGHSDNGENGSEHGRFVETADALADEVTSRRVWIAVGVCAVVTLVGLLVLWPRGDVDSTLDASELFGDRVEAIITGGTEQPCSYDPLAGCHRVMFQLLTGDNARTNSSWEFSSESSTRHFDDGDEIFVFETTLADGSITYEFDDFQRSTPLVLLALIFVVAVLLLARWKGLGAIGGLVASLLVLTVFMLPSLLRGNSALAVALVGSSLIAFIALYLAHGINIATSVALLSTFASLAVIGLLSWVFVAASNFTGFTEDSSFVLSALGVQIDARGLLLAGIVIGSLGVLDDVTVTQVSAVWELRQLQPDASRREIYTSAVNIGRDHISSTVNTLFLTYAGAALPLMLLFAVAGRSISAVSTSEVVATEIVRSLVGSIGLVASVPISTWLAARVLTVRKPSAMIDG